ncbi:pentatricopeptide repeat-containing protein At1g30610, chloroplastic isoform X2 [Aristolochia californica]|uniref:pentatricopeptide repeat-containing protein At1g30610, chloroplastic isoform X2 n=1 Tax=Aristolochia californica TaxID=171875 RepID=UPI0035D70A29
MICLQMGGLKVDKNGIFLSSSVSNSCYISEFSIPRTPIFCIAPSLIKTKKNRLATVKTSKKGVICAVTKVDSEKGLVDDDFIEKEFKFKPAFDDYVKAMESIQTCRDKNSTQNVDSDEDSGSNWTSRGRKNHDYTERKHGDDKGHRFSGGDDTLLEVNRQNVLLTERKNDSKDNTVQVRTDNAVRSVRDSPTSGYMEANLGLKGDREVQLHRTSDARKGNRSNERFERKSFSGHKNYSKMETKQRQRVVKEPNQSAEKRLDTTAANKNVLGMERSYRLGESDLNRRAPFSKTISQSNLEEQMNNADTYESINGTSPRKMDLKKMENNSIDNGFGSHETENSKEIQGISPQKDGKTNNNYIQAEKIYRFMQKKDHKSKSSQVFMDDEEDDQVFQRKAFKTFEEFKDVRGRPRVLRMEMEERIQKLAKRLHATDLNIPEWQFSKMMHSAQIRFTDHTILRVVQILGTLGNWRRVLQVVEWLHSCERFKSQKSRYIYTTVLNVLGKARRPVEALNVFHAMRKKFSSYPDMVAYHCIAVTLGQAGHMKELFDVIDCMRALPEKKFKTGMLERWDPRLEPDVIVYNAVLNACVQRKQWEGAFWVHQQLKERNIQPSSTTYGLVMEVMYVSGKYNLVHEFFLKVEKSSIPNALNYKVLVNTLWKEGKTEEAITVVQDMERRGIVGSASLYYGIARCLCSAGRPKEALQQVNKICKVATKPLVVTITGLIRECLEAGSIKNADFIFSHLYKFCSPNIVTYNIMLKAYRDHGMFEDAKELFQKILEEAKCISCVNDYKEKVVPDKLTFNTMLEACVAEKDWDYFEAVYQQMLHHGYHFNVKSHLRMIMEASRAGKGDPLDATWNHLVRSGRVPPPPIVKERFCMELQAQKFVAAVACISRHEETAEYPFTIKAWLDLFYSNANRFHSDTIFRLVETLTSVVADDDRPKPILQNLLAAGQEFINRH